MQFQTNHKRKTEFNLLETPRWNSDQPSLKPFGLTSDS